ncbi:MAG TPA: RNA 2',3'-cyclic phosphodiesterase [Burkholderiaceae bacterium]
MARIFFAFVPDRRKREAVVGWRDTCDFGPAARLVPADNLHVTLYFLGEVAPDAIEGLQSAATAVPFAAGHIELRTPEVWEHGVAVLRAKPSRELLDLRARLEGATAPFARMPGTRPWKPHLTLARQASADALAITPASPPLGGWEVRRFGLFESRAGRYREIASFTAS